MLLDVDEHGTFIGDYRYNFILGGVKWMVEQLPTHQILIHFFSVSQL